MTRAVVATPQAEAQIYLHGAHVAHYQPRGERSVLFRSAHSRFEPGKPIRGGVPIVFPWFGPGAGDPGAPAHGFARLVEWRVELVTQTADGFMTLVLGLDGAKTTHAAWPHGYELLWCISVGSALELVLDVRNASAHAITFEEALHSYLAVSDVRHVSIVGLAGTQYLDKRQDRQHEGQGTGARADSHHGRDGSRLP